MPKQEPDSVTDTPLAVTGHEDLQSHWRRVVGRRSFPKGVGVAGFATASGGTLTASEAIAETNRLTAGDVAILRFLAGAEIIESDLWHQYNELGGLLR